jgi:hypothetical protein
MTADRCLAQAARCELKAKRARRPEDREWQTVLAKVYRVLAELRQHREH